MDLEVTTQQLNDFVVLAVAGEVDMESAPLLREQTLAQLTGGPDRVVIDMSDVTFMDSSGLSVLVAALKRIRSSDGELRLVITRERTMKLFRVTALDTVFSLHGSTQDAVNGVPLDTNAVLPA